MNSISKTVGEALFSISDQGNVIISKLFFYLGFSGSLIGIGTGVAEKVVTHSADVVLVSSSYQAWDTGSVCGIGGLCCFVIKTSVDIYFAHKKDKRERLEFESKQDQAKQEYRKDK